MSKGILKSKYMLTISDVKLKRLLQLKSQDLVIKHVDNAFAITCNVLCKHFVPEAYIDNTLQMYPVFANTVEMC